jgi:hypothetical protein
MFRRIEKALMVAFGLAKSIYQLTAIEPSAEPRKDFKLTIWTPIESSHLNTFGTKLKKFYCWLATAKTR